jgi:hypothetical protein
VHRPNLPSSACGTIKVVGFHDSQKALWKLIHFIEKIASINVFFFYKCLKTSPRIKGIYFKNTTIQVYPPVKRINKMFLKIISCDTQWVSGGYSLGITGKENDTQHFMRDLQLEMGPI